MIMAVTLSFTDEEFKFLFEIYPWNHDRSMCCHEGDEELLDSLEKKLNDADRRLYAKNYVK